MQQKLITFAVPCYNSAAYMRHCIETLLSAGEQGLLIACGSGGLLVTDVQLEGSTRMNISQLIAGHPNLKDIHFDV